MKKYAILLLFLATGVDVDAQVAGLFRYVHSASVPGGQAGTVGPGYKGGKCLYRPGNTLVKPGDPITVNFCNNARALLRWDGGRLRFNNVNGPSLCAQALGVSCTSHTVLLQTCSNDSRQQFRAKHIPLNDTQRTSIWRAACATKVLRGKDGKVTIAPYTGGIHELWQPRK